MSLNMRARTHLLAAAALATGCLLAPAAQAGGGELLAGDYVGKGKGIKATVAVDGAGDGVARYAIRTGCGAARGSLTLRASASGVLKGKRTSGNRTVSARLAPGRSSAAASGWIRYAAAGAEPCKEKRSFDASFDLAGSPLVDQLSGHYAGVGEDGGLPISFDVGYDKGEGALVVRGLSFETETECWNDGDGDGVDDSLVARVAGLGGEVDPDGYFEIAYTPDEDSEFYVEGILDGGDADLYVEVGGFFADDGTPLTGGPLECDSWGEDYFASKDG